MIIRYTRTLNTVYFTQKKERKKRSNWKWVKIRSEVTLNCFFMCFICSNCLLIEVPFFVMTFLSFYVFHGREEEFGKDEKESSILFIGVIFTIMLFCLIWALKKGRGSSDLVFLEETFLPDQKERMKCRRIIQGTKLWERSLEHGKPKK